MRLFCFGFGYVAQHLADALPGVTVHGTTRQPSADPRLVIFKDDQLDAAGAEALANATHVMVSIPPDESGDDAALRYLKTHKLPALEWLGYLSTTGVYGPAQGDWVDERSPAIPTEPRSVFRLKAEYAWQAHGATIFRLAGIYGPGRNAYEEMMAGRTKQRIDAPGHVFCRIHVGDIVQVLKASMARHDPGAIYNLADDCPSESRAVIEYAAELSGVEPPPLVMLQDAVLSPMAQSFYRACRRVKNDKIKQHLGVNLLYPDYKAGLLASKLHIQRK